jgi:hypothetical protein
MLQGEVRKFARRIAALSLLALVVAMPVSARDAALFDHNGQPRSERAQWVYRIVAKWGGHVHEAYRTDPRHWAASMGPAFARASLPALRKAAQARSFAAMNDALLAPSAPAAALTPTAASGTRAIGTKALGDPDKDLVYVPVTPCRIIDTRVAGGPIPANSVRDFDLADAVRFSSQGGDTGNCGVGDKGSFAAAAINFTVVNPSMGGFITAFPYLASRPNTATVNHGAGDIRNGFSIVRLDQGASIPEFSVYSVAQTHLVADIVGYFINPPQTPPPLYGHYWATSSGNHSCSSVCNSAGGAAVATSSGTVCKAANGASYINEYWFPISPGFYNCGGQGRTAQCSCLRN